MPCELRRAVLLGLKGEVGQLRAVWRPEEGRDGLVRAGEQLRLAIVGGDKLERAEAVGANGDVGDLVAGGRAREDHGGERLSGDHLGRSAAGRHAREHALHFVGRHRALHGRLRHVEEAAAVHAPGGRVEEARVAQFAGWVGAAGGVDGDLAVLEAAAAGVQQQGAAVRLPGEVGGAGRRADQARLGGAIGGDGVDVEAALAAVADERDRAPVGRPGGVERRRLAAAVELGALAGAQMQAIQREALVVLADVGDALAVGGGGRVTKWLSAEVVGQHTILAVLGEEAQALFGIHNQQPCALRLRSEAPVCQACNSGAADQNPNRQQRDQRHEDASGRHSLLLSGPLWSNALL